MIKAICGRITRRFRRISRNDPSLREVTFKPDKLSADLINVVSLNVSSNRKKENEVVVVVNDLSLSVNEDTEIEGHSHEPLQPSNDNDKK